MSFDPRSVCRTLSLEFVQIEKKTLIISEKQRERERERERERGTECFFVILSFKYSLYFNIHSLLLYCQITDNKKHWIDTVVAYTL